MMYQGDVDMTGMRYAEVFKYQYAGMLCQAGARPPAIPLASTSVHQVTSMLTE